MKTMILLARNGDLLKKMTDDLPKRSRMRIENNNFQSVDWAKIPATEHAGTTGCAYWRTLEQGNLRLRMVEYTPGYVADHWCERGHVVLVLEGELVTELRDGRRFDLRSGMSYQVGEGVDAHRSSSPKGARLFIVD